jgi:Iron-containing redox enzyme
VWAKPRARRIVLAEEGPVLVHGPGEEILLDGRPASPTRAVTALCTSRCSRRYPLGDTRHRRRQLEQIFITALRSDVPGGTDVTAEVDALLVEVVDADGISHYLRRGGQLWQLREYVMHRSLYHLKEADPQAWVIPRLHGSAKAALVTVEHDEYGSGNPKRMHARLFATMMTELGLCAQYGAYLDAVPAQALSEVNFMSLCGLHRRLRGALIGQFATVELTSSPGSHRLVCAMRRPLSDAPST